MTFINFFSGSNFFLCETPGQDFCLSYVVLSFFCILIYGRSVYILDIGDLKAISVDKLLQCVTFLLSLWCRGDWKFLILIYCFYFSYCDLVHLPLLKSLSDSFLLSSKCCICLLFRFWFLVCGVKQRLSSIL